MRPRPITAALAFVLGALAPGAARAQTIENASLPGPGRVPVRVESTRGGAITLGVSNAPPRVARPGTSFTSDANARFCRTPCTLYLRPGVRRIVGDAESDFAWSTDLVVPPSGGVNLRLRGHLLGGSAGAGALFFLGLAGVVAGPALIIVSAVAGEPRAPLEVVVAGSVATVAGGLALWASFALLDWAAPRVDGLSVDGAPASIAPRAARRPEAPRHFAVIPALDFARSSVGVAGILAF